MFKSLRQLCPRSVCLVWWNRYSKIPEQSIFWERWFGTIMGFVFDMSCNQKMTHSK